MIWQLFCKFRQVTSIRWPHWLYKAYLNSRTWQQKRALIIRRADGECELCGRNTVKFEIHHMEYTRLGAENLDDLAALCIDCHKAVHSW